MRNALILLLAVAALILIAGGVNHGVAFDVDYVAGTIKAVSFFWVAAIVAALVFVVGILAAWLAQSTTVATRRKLEAELQSTYERLREAEALAARPARITTPETTVVSAAEQTGVTAGGQTAVTTVVVAGTAGAEETTVNPEGAEGTPVETVVDAEDAQGTPEETTPAESTSVTVVADGLDTAAGADGTPAA